MSRSVTIANQNVPLIASRPEMLDKVLEFQPFREWVERFDRAQRERQSEMDIVSIEVQNIDMFGSGKVGFVKFKADVRFKETGQKAPGIVFMAS